MENGSCLNSWLLVTFLKTQWRWWWQSLSKHNKNFRKSRAISPSKRKRKSTIHTNTYTVCSHSIIIFRLRGKNRLSLDYVDLTSCWVRKRNKTNLPMRVPLTPMMMVDESINITMDRKKRNVLNIVKGWLLQWRWWWGQFGLGSEHRERWKLSSSADNREVEDCIDSAILSLLSIRRQDMTLLLQVRSISKLKNQ